MFNSNSKSIDDLHFSDDGSYDLSVERKNSRDFSGSDSSSILSFKMNDIKTNEEKNDKFTIDANVVASYARTNSEFESVYFLMYTFIEL